MANLLKLGRFQTAEQQGWKGLTKDNHIDALVGHNGPKKDAVMIRIMDYNFGQSLHSFLRQFPVKYFEPGEEIKWKLIGSSRRNIPLVEARDMAGNVIGDNDTAGANGEPFYLVFAEDYFADGNRIVGEKNEAYPLLSKGDCKIEGTLYVYMVELMGGITSGMPGEELQPGKRFSDDFSPVEEELSRKVGDVRFATSTAMRNDFSTIRLQHKVAGNKLNRKLWIGIPLTNPTTGAEKISNRWMDFEEWAVEEQFTWDKDYVLAYAVSNMTDNGEYLNYGKSGNIIKEGAGIIQQMSYGNVELFNSFSLKQLENILYDLLPYRATNLKDRVVILDTGMRGAAKFSQAVAATASGWQQFSYFSAQNPAVIQKVNSDLHSNAFSAGFQFVEWKAPMGLTVRIRINPMKDDPVRNKILHPEGGPAESYSYDVYSLGNTQQPNIQIAKIKGEEDFRGYQSGFRNPYTGEKDIKNMSYDEDSAVIHRYAQLGSIVYNPNDCVRLRPAILSGVN